MLDSADELERDDLRRCQSRSCQTGAR